MTEAGRQRAPGWYRRSVVIVLAAALGVPAVDGALWLQQTRAATAPGSSEPRSGTAAPTPVQNGASTPPPSAVADLLRRRSEAVVSGDRSAWLDTVDTADQAVAQRQGELFDRLTVVRPTSWTYTVQPADATLTPDRQAALGPSAVLAHVRLAYRLDARGPEIERDQHLTVAQRGGRWLVVGDRDGRQQADLWDLGPVTVARGSRSVVVGAARSSLPVARTAAEADGAARRVDGVWGTGWPRSVVVMVPASLDDMAQLLDRSSSAGLAQLAAVTTGELRSGAGSGRTAGDRVVVNPVAFPELSTLGRGVVLTHELTHVATRAAVAQAPPLWVDEGFADYVAYLDTPLGPRDIAGDLLDDPAALAAVRNLPEDAAFDPAKGKVGVAYAQAWLAMRFVASQGGTPMVLDFYRVAAGLRPLRTWRGATPPRPSLAPRTPLEHACADVVGYLEPSFVRRWAVFVRSRAAG